MRKDFGSVNFKGAFLGYDRLYKAWKGEKFVVFDIGDGILHLEIEFSLSFEVQRSL